MGDMDEVMVLVREGRDILRTRRPNERQRKWREWREQVKTVCETLNAAERPRLQLSFKAITQDITALDQWLIDNSGEFDPPPPQTLPPHMPPPMSPETAEVDAGAAEDDSAAESTNDGAKTLPGQRQRTRVFLSYRSTDEKIARAVKQELESLDDRIDVFAAYDDLRRGGRWKQQLMEELKAASWFILIYTDPEMDWQWPIYEATTFEALHAGQSGGDQRLCCLHDTDARPKPLSEYQANRISLFQREQGDDEEVTELKKERFYEESAIFRFLRDFIQYPADAPLTSDIRRYEPRLVEAAHAISDSFVKNRQDSVTHSTYYPARIEITFRPERLKANGNGTIARGTSMAQASVFLGPIAQSIFRLANTGDLPWEEFRRNLSDEAQGQSLLWLEQLEEALLLAADGRRPDPVMATFYSVSNRRFYRPLLTRQEYYLSGKRTFYVLLVEQPPADFSQHEEQGILLAGLILGSRFRFEFIDRRVEQLKGELDDEDFRSLCANIKSQILAIESEAAQHGLLDRESLIQCFPRSDQETVSGWYEKWGAVREEVFAALDDEDAAVARQPQVTAQLLELLDDKLRAINVGFMRMGSQRYGELVHDAFKPKRRRAGDGGGA